MTAVDKTAEQIAKDKEFVNSMRGAKDNMVSALNRISELERVLKLVQNDCSNVAKAFGDSAHFNIWHGQGYAVRKAADIFGDIDKKIKAVL